MSEVYVLAVSRLRWLMDALEERLTAAVDGMRVDADAVRRLVPNQLPSLDEASAAIEALVDLGILNRDGSLVRLDLSRIHATCEYRRGVRDSLSISHQKSSSPVTLCAALPAGLDPRVETALRSHSVDLRSMLLGIIASARERIILASPFWDTETTSEIAELLARRLQAGVRADILGRFEEHQTSESTVLLMRLREYGQCRLYTWYEPNPADPFGAQTFHFKAAVADRGAKAYLGTANMTTSGLRSRMELGVVVGPEPGYQLSLVLDIVLRLARQLVVR